MPLHNLPPGKGRHHPSSRNGMVIAISLFISEREGMVILIDTLPLPIKERVIMVIGITLLLGKGMG